MSDPAVGLRHVPNESRRYAGNGHGNVWSMLAGDHELCYVYLPTAPSQRLLRRHRRGDHLFSESIIAVDIGGGLRLAAFALVERSTRCRSSGRL